MGISYQQTCRYGPCWMCSDTGIVVGNGSAANGGAPPRRGIEMDAAMAGAQYRKCANPDCYNLLVGGGRLHCDEHRRRRTVRRAA